jgi:hypothetical protein
MVWFTELLTALDAGAHPTSRPISDAIDHSCGGSWLGRHASELVCQLLIWHNHDATNSHRICHLCGYLVLALQDGNCEPRSDL